MTPKEFAEECRCCNSPERAFELLRSVGDVVAENERLTSIAYRMKERIERDSAAYKELQEKLGRAEAEAKILREKLDRCEIEVEELSAENDAIKLELAARERVDVLLGELNKKTDAIFECVAKPAPAAADAVLQAVSEAAKPAEPEPLPKKEKAAPRKASLEKSFAEFWAAYPKKKGKKEAFKVWTTIAPCKELFGRIMSALRVQAASEDWKRDGGQFIPYPATWLRGERWEDELTVKDSGTTNSGGHSYDLDKLLSHAKNNIPTIKKEDSQNEDK